MKRLVLITVLAVALGFGVGVAPAHGAVAIAVTDSYRDGLSNGGHIIAGNWSVSQSFAVSARGALHSARFSLAQDEGIFTGNIYAELYAAAGTYGVNSIPIGNKLAMSAPVAVSAIPSTWPNYTLVNFQFDGTVWLEAGQQYVIVLRRGAGTGQVSYETDISELTPPHHSGNQAYTRDGPGWQTDRTDDVYFYVYVVMKSPTTVYRFYNVTNGSHFYTPSIVERDNVTASWPTIYTYEGAAYSVNELAADVALYRFYNVRNGSHFYTASEGEYNSVLANWPSVFTYEGRTYKVDLAPSPGAGAVYRFYNMRNGSHFYTASEAERDYVKLTWPNVYAYEGPAFYLPQ